MIRLKLLFVDDDEMVLRAMRNLLFRERERWDMTFVCGGQAALEAMATSQYDAIISDMRMPDVDGARVMQMALQSAPGSARIMLTGSDSAAMQHVVALLHTWVSKPCDKQALCSAIELAIERARAEGATATHS